MTFYGYDNVSQAKDFYESEGYLVLKQWFPASTIELLTTQARELWNEPRNEKLIVDFGDGPLANARMLLKSAPASGAKLNHKINDLFLESDAFRGIFLDRRLVDLLAVLVEGEPTICNSLSFTQGSQQRAHFDSWYMPPPVEDRMVVAAVPLEDYTVDNGPLFYYPRSHKIPKYKFSTGHIRAIEAEMPKCDEYVNAEIKWRGIRKETFLCHAGDLFIWHSQLYHGGSAVKDPSKTRRSVVVHYWRHGDIDKTSEYPWLKGKEKPSHAGYYIAREHQAPGKVVDSNKQLENLGRKIDVVGDPDLPAKFAALLDDRTKAQKIMEFQQERIRQLEAELSALTRKPTN